MNNVVISKQMTDRQELFECEMEENGWELLEHKRGTYWYSDYTGRHVSLELALKHWDMYARVMPGNISFAELEELQAITAPHIGQRLNEFNQVELYEGVVADLGLKQGDLVYFLRNQAGRWEVRAEPDVLAQVGASFDDDNKTANSFRRAWQEASDGLTSPVSELFDGIE